MKKGQPEDSPLLPKRWIDCPVEEQYFGDRRKSNKSDRKRAIAKDRSKYKKTDQKMVASHLKNVDTTGLDCGRVLSIASQGIYVQFGDEVFLCTLRGVLKKEKTRAKNLVTVGDFVYFEKDDAGEGIISHVEPRRTILSRADNLSRRKEQLIAANIDQVIITTSVVSPAFKPPLVDRYIIASEKGGMEPVVVINKIDLLNDPSVDKALLEEENALYFAFLEAYKELGIPVIPLSVVTGEGIEALKKVMRDKASVFSGQSGVGKSSLINAITGENLATGGMVERTNKGTHTTTAAKLLPLEFGGFCVDTPGIKSFGVWDLDRDLIQHYFSEIFAFGRECRYPDCSHLTEEECAVVSAVKEGKISLLRYQSYFSLMLSLSDDHIRR